ncbi:hypothetical protein V8E36_005881 [Tilletia maclaganii]
MRRCHFFICTLVVAMLRCHFLTFTLTVAMRRVPFWCSTLLRHFRRFVDFSHDSRHTTLRSNPRSTFLNNLILAHFDNHHFPLL